MSRLTGSIRYRMRGEEGFSLAEVMMAGLILAVSVFPMVGMFDGAYRVSTAATDINTSSACLQFYTEVARSTPFYVAHTEADLTTPKDFDDFYWGTRSTVTSNNWSSAPRVTMKAFDVQPYPNMKVTLKMAYLDDELAQGRTLEEAANLTVMDSNWKPMALYGYDRPKDENGKALNLIMYEVMVTTKNGRSFTSTELYASPTDVVANVYIDRVVNVSEASKQGTRYNSSAPPECISAPHNVAGITVRAYGIGFTASDVEAGLVSVRLVNVKDTDLELKNVVYGEEDGEEYLEGNVTLMDGKGDEAPWGPTYRMPGYWHVWLVVNHVISVRNNAFVVEYPAPVYHEASSDFHDSDENKAGEEKTSDETFTITNVDYVIDLLQPDPSQNQPGVGAVIQLVHTNPDLASDASKGIITATSMQLSSTTKKGYETGLTVTAHFNFNGKVGGDYMLRIINCISRASASIEVVGNTYFELTSGPFYHLEGPPAISETYVSDTLTAQHRHFAYDDRGYDYVLEITGANFDGGIYTDDIKLGLGGDISDLNNPSGSNEILPSEVEVDVENQTIRATFSLAPQVEESERGVYWLWVRNSNDYGAILNPAFEVRAPAPIVYGYTLSEYGGFWQNYYDVGVELVGECFDADAVGAPLFEVIIEQVSDPQQSWVATEAMEEPVATDFGRMVSCSLNLIDCDAGDWELYGRDKSTAASDSGYADIISGVEYAAYIPVEVGTPTLLTSGVPAAGEPWSVKVESRYRNWNSGSDVWKDWKSWTAATEGDGTPAWVYENDEGHGDAIYTTQGVMYFIELRGKGFNLGTVDVNCINDPGENTPAMNATWQNITVQTDRAGAAVWISMAQEDAKTTGPHVDEKFQPNPISLRVKNNVSGVWSEWFGDRISVAQGPQY